MVPIHDTDVGSERWSKAEWEHYELWEKTESRMRKRKGLWIGATALVFLLISSIPVIMDRSPKWAAMKYSRKLASEISAIKRQAGIDQQAFRLKFTDGSKLDYVIEKSPRCNDPSVTIVRGGNLADGKSTGDAYEILSSPVAKELSIPGIVQSFCYDAYSGSEPSEKGENLVGFAIIPVKDLTAKKTDRISIVLLKGPSAEISFD
jgi:hypothetical protein